MSGALSQFSARKAVAAGGFDIYSLPWASIHWAEDPDWTPPADGSTVTSWRDGGTNGAALTSPAEGNRPTYRASGINGRPALEFIKTTSASTSDYMQNTTDVTAPTGAPWTRVVVLRSRTSPATYYVTDGAGTSGERGMLIARDAENDWVFGVGGVNAISAVAANSQRRTLLVGELTASGGVSLERDGTVIATASGAATSTAFADIRLGGNRGTINATLGHDGWIAFHGLLPRLLTTTEKSDLLAWADDLYALESI